MFKKNRKIRAFYNRKQVCQQDIQGKSYSKSPLKPMLLMQHLSDNNFVHHLEIESNFEPFEKEDFHIAHTKSYVNNFFKGEGNCKSNSLPWSKELVESVTYTNASLYNAIKYAVKDPDTITFSPTSGFHHAGPNGGAGFCTFSGQVIAAAKIFEETGKRAAFLDLDGHFGNSIEDSRSFDINIDKAIPFNINPHGKHEAYVEDFGNELSILTSAFLAGDVDYVVWCHGADSHEWDQLGSQCSTAEWLQCSQLFYAWIDHLQELMQQSVPVTIALFGGYRDDDYNSVLSLHASDLRECINILCEGDVLYETKVKPAKTHLARENQRPAYTTHDAVHDAVQDDVWDLKELTAKSVVELIDEVLNIKIEISPKNKKRVIKKAYKLLIENDYV